MTRVTEGDPPSAGVRSVLMVSVTWPVVACAPSTNGGLGCASGLGDSPFGGCGHARCQLRLKIEPVPAACGSVLGRRRQGSPWLVASAGPDPGQGRVWRTNPVPATKFIRGIGWDGSLIISSGGLSARGLVSTIDYGATPTQLALTPISGSCGLPGPPTHVVAFGGPGKATGAWHAPIDDACSASVGLGFFTIGGEVGV